LRLGQDEASREKVRRRPQTTLQEAQPFALGHGMAGILEAQHLRWRQRDVDKIPRRLTAAGARGTFPAALEPLGDHVSLLPEATRLFLACALTVVLLDQRFCSREGVLDLLAQPFEANKQQRWLIDPAGILRPLRRVLFAVLQE